jgi:hypothetical protein
MRGFKTITAAAAVAGSLLLAACAGSPSAGGGPTGGPTPTAVGGSGGTATPTASDGTGSTPTASDSTTATPTASDSTGSTPPSSDQAAAAPDVCTVLTAAQVAAILGVASVTTSDAPPTIAYISSCGYSPPADGPHPYPVQVTLDVKDGSASTFGSMQQALAPTTAISGVGDAAFSYAAGIYVLSGTNVIQINGPAGANLSDDFSANIAIAKDLIAALP